MKKQMTTQATGIRSSFARLLAAGFLIAGSSFAAQAQTAKTAVDADIKYAGTSNDKILFAVEYSNVNGEPFTVELKDGDGYVFYNNHFKDKKFKKFFAIDKSELDRASITIQVANKNGVQKQVFDVNTTSRFVQDVNVSVVKL